MEEVEALADMLNLLFMSYIQVKRLKGKAKTKKITKIHVVLRLGTNPIGDGNSRSNYES